MNRGSRAPLLLCLTLALATTSVARPAIAQRATTTAAEAPSADDQTQAQEHFQRAKELYSSGKYSDAIAELEVARSLDPAARDLVMNLGIVHEKLGKYDAAIRYLKELLEMDGVTPAERARAEGMIKRLEGAKEATPAPAQDAANTTTNPKESNGIAPAPPPHGRVDALTIAAGSVAAVGLALGAGLGIYALSSRPGSGFVTGRDGSYATLEQRTADAHDVAIVADVSLGVGVVAAIATAWLYFGRPTAPAPAAAPKTGATTAGVSASPAASGSGAALFFGGTF